MNEYFYSGKIYHAQEVGHIQTGYFSCSCEAPDNASISQIINEATSYLAEEYGVEEKCIHIENLQLVRVKS